MSVVVSDTSPLHYLILCGAEGVLPRLFRQVVIPPTVFRELQQPNTPPAVRQWAAALPQWLAVQSPKTVNLKLDIDAGELEAICLAQEIHADAVLMDDRAGRSAAFNADWRLSAPLVCWNRPQPVVWLNCRRPLRDCARQMPASTLNSSAPPLPETRPAGKRDD